ADGIDPGATHTSTKTVTIPTSTTPNTYYLVACADDKNAVDERDETNNCLASATAIVTVARPDLVDTAVTSNPPAPVRAPGATFAGPGRPRSAATAPAGPPPPPSSLPPAAATTAGPPPLTAPRGAPALAPGTPTSASVTVTIPPATPVNTYYLLACA